MSLSPTRWPDLFYQLGASAGLGARKPVPPQPYGSMEELRAGHITPAVFFMLGEKMDPIPDDDNAELRANELRAKGFQNVPLITAKEQFDLEVAVRDGRYDDAMKMLEANRELLKHVRLSGNVLRWPIVDYPAFRDKFPEDAAALTRLQQERRHHMASLGISD